MVDPGTGTQAAPSPQEAVAAWRSSGAWRVDPARFLALEALARRAQDQPPALRALLHARLEARAGEFALQVQARQQEAANEAARIAARAPRLAAQARRLQAAADVAGLRRLAAQAAPARGPSPLAELLQSLRPAAEPAAGESDELPSVRRFRDAWDRQHILEQVEAAVARKPANAGPLNSHALLLQALEQMRALSPEYLRHFVAYVRTLQGLERIAAPAARPDARKKPARRGAKG